MFTGSGTHWAEVQELTPSDGVANDEFGVSVAIRNSGIVVGAECHSSSGPTCAGAAYLLAGTGGHWTQQVELDAPGQAANDYFGWPVAFVGKSIAVGATGEDSAQGSVFIYATHKKVWSQQGVIAGSGAQAGNLFGSGLAVGGKEGPRWRARNPRFGRGRIHLLQVGHGVGSSQRLSLIQRKRLFIHVR